MKNIIQTEWWKLRRCQILLVGIVALALCPVVQYGTQLIVNPEIRDPDFDFVHLFANVVWGNTPRFWSLSARRAWIEIAVCLCGAVIQIGRASCRERV